MRFTSSEIRLIKEEMIMRYSLILDSRKGSLSKLMKKQYSYWMRISLSSDYILILNIQFVKQ